MAIDKYTKIVLTIIALALLGLLFKDVPVVPSAYAVGAEEPRAPQPQITDVNIVQIAGWSIPKPDPRQRSHQAFLPVVVGGGTIKTRRE
jgi:hypothetical protein